MVDVRALQCATMNQFKYVYKKRRLLKQGFQTLGSDVTKTTTTIQG